MSLLTWVLSLIVRLFYQEPVVVQRATGAPVEELVRRWDQLSCTECIKMIPGSSTDE